MNFHAIEMHLFFAMVAALMLTSCAPQTIRNEATTKLREGSFEIAIADLQSGIKEYPESPTLRAGLVAARSEAIARLVAQITQFRALGQFDEADKSINRALALEPGNARLLGLQGDLQMARRLRSRLEDVNSLVASGKKEQALRLVESNLREVPRQADLVALQRRLELELRLDGNNATARNLADSRPITLDFRNAPLSTVLEAITRGSGINFILDRDVRQDSRVTLFLRSAKVDDAIELVTGAHQLARRVVDPQTVLIYPNTPEKQREHQEQVIRVFHLSSADAKATAALLRAMLRIKDPFIDEQANLIAIRETPEIVTLAERLVALHDVSAAEVMLDVEILEVKTSRLTELGINFPNTLALTPLASAGAGGLTVSSLRGLNEDRIGVSVAGLLINLRREVGDFNILANPRIRTKSREKARIMIGDKVPVVTTTTSATGFVGETVNYLDVGLKLEVEPVVAPDDDVTIKLALEVSTVAREVRTASGSLAYQIGARNANTTLRLRDGETQLLAGLISNEDRSTANRVPGLGDLPIAGRLFSSQKDDVQRTELVLAITPRIIRSAARPDITQAEMWVGTEAATRLRAAPNQRGNEPKEEIRPTATSNLTGSGLNPTSKVLTDATTAVLPTDPIRASWMAPEEIKVGEPFVVSLHLSSGTPLRGAPLEIAFPTEGIEVMEVMEGGFFKQDEGVTSFTQAVNINTGRIGIGVLRNNPEGATGQATLVSLRLKAKTKGSIDLVLTSLKPISMEGAQAPILAALPILRVTAK